ncbi:MAG: hypothetical protein CSA60_03150 [Neptuniibacter caesariensis]|uniref:Flagellar assembly protein FliH n=1 Tax=Neptuniibacter caesariensis TaxID=207954 RepID=A0A2G6JMA7_NEPCE|nr:MAG: hypothetical protein CSA60_03150 [Neptuniibacter caesariensis]
MSENKGFKPIRVDEATEFDAWELPQMGGPTVVGLQQKDTAEVTVVEEVLAAEKITVAELERIRENARIEGLAAGLEEGRLKGIEEGRSQGHKEGYEAGYAEGLAKGAEDMERVKGLFSAMLEEFERPVSSSAEMLENQLIELVVSLAKAVVQHELVTRKDLLLTSIRDALQQIPEPVGTVSLRVNPVDEPYVETMALVQGVALDITPDANVQAGGYLLKAENTLVKHEVEERFAAAVEQLKANLSTLTEEGHE